MRKHIKKTTKGIQSFDKKHTNFSNHTYWGIFIATCAIWFNTFNISLANLEGYTQVSNHNVPYSNALNTNINILKILPNDNLIDIGVISTSNDTDSGYSIVAGPKLKNGGIVTFGPYEDYLNTGTEYKVLYKLKVSDNSIKENKILIDVFNWKTGHREYIEIAPNDFLEKDVFQAFSITFTRGADGYEFRTFYYPDSNFILSVDTISIEEY